MGGFFVDRFIGDRIGLWILENEGVFGLLEGDHDPPRNGR